MSERRHEHPEYQRLSTAGNPQNAAREPLMEARPRGYTVGPMNPLRVLVAGGGVAAVETVLALRALADERVTIELLAPSGDFVERPEAVRSPFDGSAVPRVPLDELGVVRHRGALAGVEPGVVFTTDCDRLPFDRLVVAVGARPVEAIPGATLFRGPLSAGAVEGAFRAERVILAAPAVGWTLPLYELALLSGHADLTIVTPEPRPLDLFGDAASEAVARRLERAGVGFIEAIPERVVDGTLATADGRLLPADAVVALPRARGPFIAGLPCDADGFVEIDAHARVFEHVFAAGDATASPIRQGGLATQQADAAAEAIAADAGAPVTPRPYTRILRAVLLTRDGPLQLCRDLDAPTHKLAGRHLTAFLAREHA
jgi:sulfide:quinone oxidoreductase